MARRHFLIFLFALGICSSDLYAQDKAIVSGGLETNFNIFLRDSLIGATNTPQYDNQITGGELWLDLNVAYKGFQVGARYDLFQNSNLLNPRDSYSDQGIGRWYIKKSINKLDIQAGYIYDQVGSGIIYRSYQQRPLLIDNALQGARLDYHFNDDWTLKVFAGNQKNLFGRHSAAIKGASLDGYISLGKDESPLTLSPGIGLVNRTLNEEVMSTLLSEIKNYIGSDRFLPQYNTVAGSFYNTLSYKSISLYTEIALKSPDVVFDENQPRINLDGSTSQGRFKKTGGSVLYGSLSYAKGKLGITLEGKRTENFNFRTDPGLQLTQGLINWLPPMSRVNTYRLTSRYAPAVQDLSEYALQLDARYRINKRWSLSINGSYVNSLSEDPLYRELYTEVTYKAKNRKWQLTSGLQLQRYNQEVYESKPGVPMLKTVTPYIDVLYKFTRKRSLRVESQYMHTEQDFGSWVFLLAEYGIAPRWIFEGSVMYNAAPTDKSPRDPVSGITQKIIYPSFGFTYIKSSNRYALKYVKQVEGIVCSGGICRLEPAFSGIKFSATSTF